MTKSNITPDYLFETSWEVCNKVGGIHTVISTKALTLVNQLKDNYILIGPDVWRETNANPEFLEDNQLFKSWRSKAAEEGLGIRVGRWNINGNPIVIIVDFLTFVPQRDNIFKKLWETYKLDSLTGGWDYVEPVLFGYAAAKVIESFTKFHLSIRDKVVAQFHEWMTGSGLLYLKTNMPQVATIFTTHATVVGRSIAGNNQPLYGKLTQYNGDVKAVEFNVIAKQSLEKLSAKNADSFVTVSDITANECAQFLEKSVDLVTPNGFEDSFVPPADIYNQQRETARNKMLEIASIIIGEELPKDSLLVGISGRYEFKNKGIDIFIDALGSLNNKSLNKNLVAFIFIPANHYGPRKDLLNILSGVEKTHIGGKVLSHNLHDAEYDPIMNKINSVGLLNAPGEKVKVIFVPCYLNGADGIFNLPYYKVLIGLDYTVFPSYYEPWGYTPLESLAFKVPTITTTLAGFGLWVENEKGFSKEAISIIHRSDDNDAEVISSISKSLEEALHLTHDQLERLRENASSLSKIALWKNFISYYNTAFDIAIRKVEERVGQIFEKESMTEQVPHVEKYQIISSPKWKRLLVQKFIPQRLSALEEISKNLWWSWNNDAEDLFESIDPSVWIESDKNPIVFLEMISYNRLLKLETDNDFLEKLNKVYTRFQDYIAKKSERKAPQIAYFSMEFGLHSSLKIYSGGLGILAGDYLKEASDSNVHLVGIGLLYHFGYFKQVISVNGDQMVVSEPQHFSKTPAIPIRDADGNWTTISIVMPGRTLYVRIWKVEVGRIDLYLLDTDFEENTPQDRSITHHLYGGDEENRFKQELLLGIGGIRALKALNINANLYHCNEGHAAFIGLERLHYFINDKNLTFPEALEIVRASTLFTTHTPVPAGHDSFEENMMRMYMSHYPERLKLNWTQFMGLGKVNASDPLERFSMSYLAANLSQEVNGVSKLHGHVSKEIFSTLWPGYTVDEIHIGYVTNGVHLPTWAAKEWKQLYQKYFGEDFLTKQINKESWEKIYTVPDREIWKIRNGQRKKLIDYIKDRMKESAIKRYENPKNLVEISEKINKFTLTIGFARRFATYKRAHLLFRDIDRLARIVNNPGMPIQFLFAGKAHPADKAGADLIKMIVEISRRPEFVGKILFLQNYDMDLAKYLVQGVDVWLNTPTRPLEASGTSGEKAVMNGVLHFSVLDGWWAEGYYPDAGWALPEEKTYDNTDFQDELDAETIYSLLENEIAPLFYFRDDDDVPTGWVRYIKNCIAKVAPNFTTTRMLRDYNEQYYSSLHKRSELIKKDDFELAKSLSSWKKKVFRAWESIEVISVKSPDISKEPIVLGKNYFGEVVLDLNELSPDDIGVEIVIAELAAPDSTNVKVIFVQEFKLISLEGKIASYKVDIVPVKTGAYDFGIRIFPKNENIPHKQDFNLVKWI